jgi:3-oxoadipate enol-lactonase
MANSKSEAGFLEVPEGKLYWVANSAEQGGSARPLLFFIHAGVSDQSLWDDQVAYFNQRGWDTLRFDLLGFGKSAPSESFLAQKPRPKIKHHELASLVLNNYLETKKASPGGGSNGVVAIGLSMGGGIVFDVMTLNPQLTKGLVVIAGGVTGLDYSEELEFSIRKEKLCEEGAKEELARLNVRYWGDGPLQPEGRAPKAALERLRVWCQDIAARECDGVGGFALEQDFLKPYMTARLPNIEIPIAVAYGTFDESGTNDAMKYLHEHAKNSTIQEFKTAHMVSLEVPDEFNRWLEEWLKQFC